MEHKKFLAAISASLANGDRLSDDAKSLFEWERYPSAYALAVLAQEEYAKALLLSLIDVGAIPWSTNVRRALHDHVCKQLVSIILNYLSPDDEEFFRRYGVNALDEDRPMLPSDVLDAIHVICHERFPLERDRWWLEEGSRPLDATVEAVADGRVDRQKQDAIYVSIGPAVDVCSTPARLTREMAEAEVERSERIGRQLRPYSREPGLDNSLDSEKLVAIFQLLTGSLKPDDFNKLWWVR